VNDDCLKLTAYFGERDRARARGGFLADALTAIYARHELRASVLMRGVEGFGARHSPRTDRLLSLSEDLPMVSLAVDSRPRIEAALHEVEAIAGGKLVTIERARMLTGPVEAVELPAELHEATKLTVYVGRHERVGRAPAHEALVALLHASGVAGATVLLGVDGTVDGEHHRARFLGRNAGVPLIVVAVAEGARIAAVLPRLGALLARPLVTLERVRVCKRDGQRLAEPRHVPESDPSGLALWHKLTVFAGEQSRHQGHPLSGQLMRELRRAGAAGATSLRGIWGYHGDHPPHGDTLWQLRRRVPVVTIVVDAPPRIRELFAIVDELTDATGLVTSEIVPAHRAGARLRARGSAELFEKLRLRPDELPTDPLRTGELR
jgi:PII-like signaling protein